MPDNSYDSIVFTLVFCTVDDPILGLSEVKRLLKPGGRVYFMEHILPTEHRLRHMFDFMTPAWKKWHMVVISIGKPSV